MRTSKKRIVVVPFVALFWALCLTGAYGQLTPSGDAYTSTAAPSTNYGAQKLLDVESASQTTYIQFDLSAIPAGYTGADVSKASLKLYVNAVTKAGSFNVDYVNGAWTEATIDASNAPGLGSTIAASVPLATADKNQYILIDITSAVQAWLSGTPNDGIALVGNSPLNASFDSKENTTTSHSAELDIVFAGGGTITGVTTANGSGLMGGGTSGTLNLSLTNSCATSQVLQWNGTAWACAAAGTGTITGVTAGTDLTDGGTSGNVTLNLNTAALNASYAQLAGANTFTGNQTVNGNLSATGVVTGSGYQIGSNLFAFGSFASYNAFLGFAGNTATTGTYNTASGAYALYNNTNGSVNTANGTAALETNTTGSGNTAIGVFAVPRNTTGNFNTGSGSYALQNNNTGSDNTATGAFTLNSNTTGNSNTANGISSLLSNSSGGYNTSSGVYALENNTTGSFNTASGYISGYSADTSNITGSNNTFLGSGSALSTGSLNNATAIGANAEVGQTNALVLGSINGVDYATASTSVGIGTTTPVYSGLPDGSTTKLNIVGDNTYVPLVVQSASSYGTWMLLNNTSSGGLDWAILSAASGDGEGAGNLGITDFGNGGTILLESNVRVTGNLSKSGGSFQIDHPLDPANKYLYHSFVESPDMMNIYNGIAVLDIHGAVWITLPEYFEALNQDFRYQLTSMGGPQPSLYVAREIRGNRFKVAGGKPAGKVSWQVTGIRHDAYANAHRIRVEEEKPPQEQGHYLHPELFGAPPDKAIGAHAAPPATSKIATTASLQIDKRK